MILSEYQTLIIYALASSTILGVFFSLLLAFFGKSGR